MGDSTGICKSAVPRNTTSSEFGGAVAIAQQSIPKRSFGWEVEATPLIPTQVVPNINDV